MPPISRRPTPPRRSLALVLVLAGAAGAAATAPVRPADAPLRSGEPSKAVVLPLPPAPDLSAVPASFDRLPLKLRIAGDSPLRVQVADDAAFAHVQLDLTVPAGDDVRIPRLGDGTWHLRVRRIGAAGQEGPAGVREFQLRARPESPFLLDPPANAKRSVGDITLRWTHNPDAAGYVVEVARDARFAQVAQRDENVHGERIVFHPVGTDYGAADGVYWWRVVSVDAAGRRGAWSDAQALILRPAPRAPIGHLSADGTAIELMWGGGPQDRVEVELAADAGYRRIVARGEFAAPNGRFARPAAGTYHARYRFIEPDGFRTDWSGDAKIIVERDWRRAWRMLVPDALLRRAGVAP